MFNFGLKKKIRLMVSKLEDEIKQCQERGYVRTAEVKREVIKELNKLL
jgi:hypothetical protein